MQTKKRANLVQWERDKDKESFWRKQIADWHASGLSVRAFARGRQLPEPRFYAWRRELALRDLEFGESAQVQPESAVKRVYDSRGRLIPLQKKSVSSRSAAPVFVPLKTSQKGVPVQMSEPEVSKTGFLDLHLHGICFIRVFEDTDMDLLTRVVTIMEARR